MGYELLKGMLLSKHHARGCTGSHFNVNGSVKTHFIVLQFCYVILCILGTENVTWQIVFNSYFLITVAYHLLGVRQHVSLLLSTYCAQD